MIVEKVSAPAAEDARRRRRGARSWRRLGLGPFRRFRVLLLRPNAAAPNPRHVSLSWIELYGNLYLAGGEGESVAAEGAEAEAAP